jgi:hypothetical protein
VRRERESEKSLRTRCMSNLKEEGGWTDRRGGETGERERRGEGRRGERRRAREEKVRV